MCWILYQNIFNFMVKIFFYFNNIFLKIFKRVLKHNFVDFWQWFTNPGSVLRDTWRVIKNNRLTYPSIIYFYYDVSKIRIWVALLINFKGFILVLVYFRVYFCALSIYCGSIILKCSTTTVINFWKNAKHIFGLQ